MLKNFRLTDEIGLRLMSRQCQHGHEWAGRHRAQSRKVKMKLIGISIFGLAAMTILGAAGMGAEATRQAQDAASPLDMKKAEAEVESRYAKAHPEIREYV